ncbi:TPA: ead/Ea22-like family protein [Enterobacter cloacae]|uniref:ead/Ea22-like family protein n=1 Tax=Enterobacter cloacae TaxID=550 RepID=UPI003B23E906
MSNIDKRALREAAEKASTDNHTQDEWFHYLGCSRPATVLALLDELEAAERRIAELTEKPIGWTDEQELRDVEKLGCGYLFNANPITPHADPRRVILLYAAAAGKGE